MITYNKPFLTGKELAYIDSALKSKKLAGNGFFTKACQKYFEERYNFKKTLLTTSCTDALEMAAILCNIEQGDEVIIPSYTFVSTANAFILRGAKIVFIDSMECNPNLDVNLIESLITDRTRVIVPVHYAGVACDMEAIMLIAAKYNLIVVEDAAQAIDSFYFFSDGSKRSLGSIGHLGTMSFHETKNIISGEGGMLIINDEKFIQRAEVIWEKGTNRSSYLRGEINKYSWIDIGSSFLPSEIISAFLWAQLEELGKIQTKRKYIWNYYHSKLSGWTIKNGIQLGDIPKNATNNAHIFYLICPNIEFRDCFISHLKENNIQAVSHYISLHKSEYFINFNAVGNLVNSDKFTDCMVRLPLFYDLTENELNRIIEVVTQFNFEIKI
jgi:dTDP-4-amino-4,6-dideoxygalactose transaminase